MASILLLKLSIMMTTLLILDTVMFKSPSLPIKLINQEAKNVSDLERLIKID